MSEVDETTGVETTGVETTGVETTGAELPASAPAPSGRAVLPAPPEGLARAVDALRTVVGGIPQAEPADLISAAQAVGLLADAARAAELSLLAAASERGAVWQLWGEQTVAWLRGTHRVSGKQARARLHQARRIADHPRIADALADGVMSVEQADAIVGWLRFMDPELSEALTAAQLARIEDDLIGYAAMYDPEELRVLARHCLEVAAPDIWERLEQAALDRQEREARKRQYLRWSHDPATGSTYLRAKVPDADADQFRALIDAHVDAARRDRRAEGLAPLEQPTLDQDRADALLAVTEAAAVSQTMPAHGGDRPRLTIVVTADQLAERTGAGSILETGRPVSPGWWLRLACDADLLPVVVDATGVPLDVGRTKRLVTGELRQALALRDAGCAFPGCDRPARSCESHHITPWAAGGPTSLANTVLLCRHHHGLVEPDPRSVPGTRWQVRMASDGIPEFLPPDTRYGPRGLRRHARYRIRAAQTRTGETGTTSGPDPP